MTPPSDLRTWLVVYDIAHDRRRARMSQWFAARGVRVQESVFELVGTPARVAEWLAEARGPRRFDPTQDSLRAYPLCANCSAGIERWGLGPAPIGPGKPLVS